MSQAGHPSGRLRRRNRAQHACSGLDAVSHLDAKLDLRIQGHVHSRSEFDQSHAFAALDGIARAFPEYDTAGEQSSDLLDHYLAQLAAHREDVLLVLNRSACLGSDVEPAGAVGDALDCPADRRAVNVNIERRHENADPPHRSALQILCDDLNNFAVRR